MSARDLGRSSVVLTAAPRSQLHFLYKHRARRRWLVRASALIYSRADYVRFELRAVLTFEAAP